MDDTNVINSSIKSKDDKKYHPDFYLTDYKIYLEHFALNKNKRMGLFPFSKLQDKKVNTLIFPNLDSGNISYKILQELSNFETMGPVLLGMNKSVHILQLESSVNEIVHMATIGSVDAHERK